MDKAMALYQRLNLSFNNSINFVKKQLNIDYR